MTEVTKAIKTNDRLTLLKAVEFILADSASIQQEVQQLKAEYAPRWVNNQSANTINLDICEQIIANYANQSAFKGSATALASVIPGFGTVLASLGGATAGAALSMKYHIEMTMAIATVYGHDITVDKEKQACFVVAGLGAISEMDKSGMDPSSNNKFVSLIDQYLDGISQETIKEIFNKAGVLFAKNAAKKMLPFGIGVAVDFSSRKKLMQQAGIKARDFFSTTQSAT